MSTKISEATVVLTLAEEDLFALAKYTGTGPTGYASRHVSVGTLIDQLVTNETFITELTENEDFINNVVTNETFIENVETTVETTMEQVIRTIVEEEVGTTETLVLADAEHKWKTFTNASPITVTIPPQADVAWPDYAYIELHAGGAGAVTIEGGVGVTVLVNEHLTEVLYGQNAVAAIKRLGADEWILFGNLVPVEA